MIWKPYTLLVSSSASFTALTTLNKPLYPLTRFSQGDSWTSDDILKYTLVPGFIPSFGTHHRHLPVFGILPSGRPAIAYEDMEIRCDKHATWRWEGVDLMKVNEGELVHISWKAKPKGHYDVSLHAIWRDAGFRVRRIALASSRAPIHSSHKAMRSKISRRTGSSPPIYFQCSPIWSDSAAQLINAIHFLKIWLTEPWP